MRRYYVGDPRWLEARYPGTCRRCGAVIRRGDRAFYYPNGRVLYCAADTCGSAESRQFAAAAADEEFMSSF